jgi:hypothetical protein
MYPVRCLHGEDNSTWQMSSWTSKARNWEVIATRRKKKAGTKAVGFLAASRPSVSKSVSEKRAVGHATMRDGEI